MNKQVKEFLDNYPCEIVDMYNILREMIFNSASSEPKETIWAKLPSYYVGESFVRLIPFRNHICIAAKAMSEYKKVISQYNVTTKGMLQIFIKQDIPTDVLKQILC